VNAEIACAVSEVQSSVVCVIVVLASFPNAYSLQGTSGGSALAYSAAAGSQLEGKIASLVSNICCTLCEHLLGIWEIGFCLGIGNSELDF